MWINVMGKEKVGNTVHAMRIEREMTQEALAGAVGVSRQTIIAVEKGNYIPSVLLALKIAKQFKTSLEKIFFIQ